MKIIAGLGNPALKYGGTRHNVGFGVIDELSDRWNIRVSDSRMRGLAGSGVIAGEKIILLKPMTFMNLSGECIRPFMDYYKLFPEELIVCYDDINLDVGMIRVRAKGSAGGHNGMKSIIQQLGTIDFPRVRIGIGAKPPHMDLADYVLGHFPADELPVIRGAITEAADAVEMILKEGMQPAMNRFNKIKGKENAKHNTDAGSILQPAPGRA